MAKFFRLRWWVTRLRRPALPGAVACVLVGVILMVGLVLDNFDATTGAGAVGSAKAAEAGAGSETLSPEQYGALQAILRLLLSDENADLSLSNADLSLSMVSANGMPLVDHTAVFTLTVSNAGPSDASGVVVGIKLPSGYYYTGDNVAGAYFDVAGVWTIGDLANGASTSLEITAWIRATGNHTNVAQVIAANEPDPDSTPNNNVAGEDDQDTVTGPTLKYADLSLTKVFANGTPRIGGTAVFTLTVANEGPSDASGVEVVDLLPSGYAYISDDGGGAYTSGTGVWTIGNLANGASTSLGITATVLATGKHTNVAQVTAANELDPDSAPNNDVAGEDDQDRVTGPTLNLSDLDGLNGFAFIGLSSNDQTGASVSSAGDVNGDGFDDVIIGAYQATPDVRTNAGTSYVVFGTDRGIPAGLHARDLDGANGFAINGIVAGDWSGSSVSSAGDFNGDGFDDVIIGAWGANSNNTYYSGQGYVVFGKAGGFPASLELSALDGANGFVINAPISTSSGNLGNAVSSAGDINGDGFDDVIIGAASAYSNFAGSAGVSYVLFGKAGGFPAIFDLSTLDGANGFAIDGVSHNAGLGSSVSSAGDVNGDGFDDLIIGSDGANVSSKSQGNDPKAIERAGKSYVIFGKAGGFPARFDPSSLDGANGFVINGIAERDYSGGSVSSAGDVNGDGFDDVIIGASNALPYSVELNGRTGETYVVFGKAGGFPASLELSALDGTNGFTIYGFRSGGWSGHAVSSAGDINGDGFDDVIIGAFGAGPNGVYKAGESYVVFGKAGGFPTILNLRDIDGINGFTIHGETSSDHSGFSVSFAGDVNGDGIDDVIIGAPEAGPRPRNFGVGYVVFGNNDFGR